MFKKLIFTITFFNLIHIGFSQSNLNSYKYVIVPNKFDFLKEADKYQLNSLTKFLFNKYGFKVIMEDEINIPELQSDRCLALNSNVINDSGLFKTKLSVELKNCKGEVVFLTKVGETREKQYDKAYKLALRQAFESFETINYKYKPSEERIALANNKTTIEDKEIEQLKEEIKALKEEQNNTKKLIKQEVKPEIKNVPDTEPVKEPVIQPIPKTIKETAVEKHSEVSDILYAQVIADGFQLVDSSPKVVYKIKTSGLKDVFFVEGKQAIIYKSGSRWLLEFYEDGGLKTIPLSIKF